MTHKEIIAELTRIWHSPHLDLILKARLGEVIEAFKENNQSDSFLTDSSDDCKESESKLDLIRREDAITIPVMPKEHRQYQTMNIDDAYERGWYDLQDCIESLPSAEPKTGEWIPVSEKPKDEKRTYLVQLDSGGMRSCRWTNANPIWTELTTDWHWNIFDIPQYCKVVAWMDLEPCEGGDDE